MTVRPAAVIVLAAGEGTRMKSNTPKVLHTIGGRSLLGHAMTAAREAEPERLVVVVRHQRDRVVEHIGEHDPGALVADQDDIKGTGRAVECGLAPLAEDTTGTVLVISGDVPLITGETLREMVQIHEERGAAVTLLTGVVEDATGYGRIVRGEDGSVERIVEHKDATDAEREIREFNAGTYAFDAVLLRDALAGIGTDNAQGEKYLTDVIGIARSQGRTVVAHQVADLWQTEGVNDKVQLARLGKELNRRTVEKAMREGAIVIDPDTTWIDVDATVGRDTVIHPGTQILGATMIGADCTIGPDTTLTDMEVGDGASVVRSQALLSVIGPKATVGPFSYLRPGTELGAKAKIGGFVETKNATIGEGGKVPHLTYAGDAEIGAGANIGAGTIFANYDGVSKHRTTVGRDSFVGSNSVLVAPVDIGDGAYVAAGSAVTEDVEPGQIAIARGRQRNIDGWVERSRPESATERSARAARDAGTRHTPTDSTNTDENTKAGDDK